MAAAADDENDPCYYNTWEMYQMPIKASYCDAWYDACYEDSFCGGEVSESNKRKANLKLERNSSSMTGHSSASIALLSFWTVRLID